MDTTTNNAGSKLLLYAAWLTALLSLAGSLFFSEVMQLPPCVLCWWQRVAMYPLVAILAVGIIRGGSDAKWYGLPLALFGLVVAAYHNLLYYGFIPAELVACTEGVPCNAVQIELLGFITIPMMGLAAFIFITACLALYRPRGN